jgi:hypothetical protein
MARCRARIHKDSRYGTLRLGAVKDGCMLIAMDCRHRRRPRPRILPSSKTFLLLLHQNQRDTRRNTNSRTRKVGDSNRRTVHNNHSRTTKRRCRTPASHKYNKEDTPSRMLIRAKPPNSHRTMQQLLRRRHRRRAGHTSRLRRPSKDGLVQYTALSKQVSIRVQHPP